MKKVTLNLSINSNVKDNITCIANLMGITRSELVTRAIVFYAKNNEEYRDLLEFIKKD